MHLQQMTFENIVGNGAFAHHEQMLNFPPCFSMQFLTGILKIAYGAKG